MNTGRGIDVHVAFQELHTGEFLGKSRIFGSNGVAWAAPKPLDMVGNSEDLVLGRIRAHQVAWKSMTCAVSECVRTTLVMTSEHPPV